MGYKSNASWRVSLTVLLVLAFVCFFVCSVNACPEDHSVRIDHRQSGQQVVLFVPPGGALDATITVQLQLENLVSSAGDTFTTDMRYRQDPSHPLDLTLLRMINANQRYRYHYDFHFRIGNLGGKPDLNYVYALPFQIGEGHRINQSYFGEFSHQRGTDDEYAIDFDMPQGTTICAARAGYVVAARSDSNAGGPTEEFRNCANYVVIRHNDGGYAEYLHLQPGGALVQAGQYVQVGQPIALSGATGFCRGPHLHFSVYVPVSGFRKQSVPVLIATSQGVCPQLMYGYFYENSPQSPGKGAST